MNAGERSYFVFKHHGSMFAIDAMAVRETFYLPWITPLEETPPYVPGVFDLRGKIVPVLDLRIRLGHPPAGYHLTDSLIVADMKGRTAGIIVDEVLDVAAIGSGEIHGPPFPGREGDSFPRFVAGEARVGEEILMILDHDQLLGHEEFLDGLAAESGIVEIEAGEPPSPPHPGFSGILPEERAILLRRAAALADRTGETEPADRRTVGVVGLNGEYFGIDLKSVREFSNIANISPVPNCPDHIVGVMNLRGDVMTVIDIRGLLEMPVGAFRRSAKVVVASGDGDLVGIAVDDVCDISILGPSSVFPLPASAPGAVEKYATGIALYGDKAMTVLNMPEILKNENFVVDEG